VASKVSATRLSRYILSAFCGFLLGIATTFVGSEYLIEQADIAAADAELMRASEAFSRSDNYTAIKHAYLATAINPDRYSGYVILGDVFKRLSQQDMAIAMYRQALENMDKPQKSAILGTDFERMIEFDRQQLTEKLRELGVQP
jgi:Tfp pilus assembly protein PilF